MIQKKQDNDEWLAMRSVLRQAIETAGRRKASVARAIGVNVKGFSNQLSGTRGTVMSIQSYSRALREAMGIDLPSLLDVLISAETPELRDALSGPLATRSELTHEERLFVLLAARLGLLPPVGAGELLGAIDRLLRTVDATRALTGYANDKSSASRPSPPPPKKSREP